MRVSVDVLYVESLIAPDTVDTIPPATLHAFRVTTASAGSRLEENIDDAKQVMATLAQAGISIDELTARLLDDGVKEFSAAFDALLGSVEKKRAGVLESALDRMSFRLPTPLDGEVQSTLNDWRTGGKVRRLWGRDASLWTGQDENQWLDWLGIADAERGSAPELTKFATEARRDCTSAVVLGMGGSSLCPDVLQRTFGQNSAIIPSSTSSTRRIPRRSERWKRASTSRRLSSSSRASPAPRSSPISTRTTSSIASPKPLARQKRRSTSSS